MRFFWAMLAVCIGCSSIPDVVFVDESLIDGGGDAGGGDAGTDGSPPDAPVGFSCPTNPPSGTTCCGPAGEIICSGDCPSGGGAGGAAAQCKNDCRNCVGKTCCRKGGSVTCVTYEEACP